MRMKSAGAPWPEAAGLACCSPAFAVPGSGEAKLCGFCRFSFCIDPPCFLSVWGELAVTKLLRRQASILRATAGGLRTGFHTARARFLLLRHGDVTDDAILVDLVHDD